MPRKKAAAPSLQQLQAQIAQLEAQLALELGRQRAANIQAVHDLIKSSGLTLDEIVASAPTRRGRKATAAEPPPAQRRTRRVRDAAGNLVERSELQ